MDITMTAVRRPKVLDKTLKSFTKHIFKKQEDYRLIINIDPIGDDIDNDKVIDVCEKYFDNLIIFEPKKPSFPKAVIRIWEQVESEFFFHLEDDWIINRDIDLKILKGYLEFNKDLACMRLYKENIPKNNTPTMFGCKYNYHGTRSFTNTYFTPDSGSIKSKNQFGLNPVLIRKKFIDETLPLMVKDKNPEKQFRENNPLMSNILQKWIFAIYGKPGDYPLVWGKNGLHWRLNSEFKKPRNGDGFTTWIKREGDLNVQHAS